MDFFEQQDQARRNTRWLVVLFLLAVIALVIMTNAFLLLFPWQLVASEFTEQGSNRSLVCLAQSGCDVWSSIDWNKALWISIAVVSIISLVSFFKWLSIASGGKAIAKMMGGTLVSPDSDSLLEKRLINVVEEMALASNMPVPAVYVLKHESGMNAFAAGFSTKDAVVAVTQGLLESLNRDRLQAVMAHEFSHILNGDMRLNMRLIAILHGIMFITEAGFAFLRGGMFSSRRDNKSPTMFLGIGLIILGYLGTFFGNVIKAAVSRQREFLADASAVQFTRNPDAMADALKTIGGHQGGSSINDSHGSEISHLFFGASMSFAQSLFATHPPLDKRILRIQPRWNGCYLRGDPQLQSAMNNTSAAENAAAKKGKRDAQLTALVTAIVGASAAGEENTIQQDLHQPLYAAASVCGILLDDALALRHQQIEACRQLWPELAEGLSNGEFAKVNRDDFVSVVELAVSALRLLSAEDYQRLQRCMLQLIKADDKVDIYEWCLYHLLRTSLDAHFDKAVNTQPKYQHVNDLQAEILTVLNMFISATAQSPDDKQKALQYACNTLGIYQAQAFDAQVDMNHFIKAVKFLTAAYPAVKARFMKSLINAAKHDGQLESIERSMIVSLAAILECPLPNHVFDMQ